MPTAADSTIIFIGFTFLKTRTADTAKIPRNTQKDACVNLSACKPLGKNTVRPTERNAAPIIPTTAGFKPDITESTALLLLNL